ncbi:MAG: hypothetical protein WD059_07020 [Balneolaceae bacterium]
MKALRKYLNYIFPIVIIIMIGGLILSRIHRPDSSPPEPEIRIEATEADNYIGTAAEVCGEIASARYLPQIGGEPTFLNFGQPDPNQLFTAVIWGEDRNKWRNPPEEIYRNREVCVSGRIESHEGTPQIIIDHPGQIKAKNSLPK